MGRGGGGVIRVWGRLIENFNFLTGVLLEMGERAGGGDY